MRRTSLQAIGRAACGVALLSLSSCGGEDAGRLSAVDAPVTPVDQCQLAAALSYQPIVDFEPKGNSRWATCDPGVSCQSDATPTAFFFNHDAAHSFPLPQGVSGSCVTSAPFMSSVSQREVEVKEIPGGPRCGNSANAFRLTVSNVGLCFGDNGRLGWGAGLDLNFNPAFDASQWDGVSFWVKRGGETSGAAFTFAVVDQQNDAIGGDFMADEAPGCGCVQLDPQNQPRAWTCYKDPGPDFPDAKKCDPYGTAVSLTDEWSLVKVAFNRLQPNGFGVFSGAFDPSLLKRLQFSMKAGSWDYWIDDLSFYREAP